VIEKGLSDIEKLFLEVAKEGGGPKEQLKQLVLKTFDSMQRDQDFWALYASLITQMHASTTMRQIFEPMVQGSFDMLTRLFEACEIPNARMRALSIGAMMDGVGMHFLFVKKDYPIDEVANFIINDLLFPNER
jgi:hypothetical protein